MVLIDRPTGPVEPGGAIEALHSLQPEAARDISREGRGCCRQVRIVHGSGRNADARKADSQRFNGSF
jgi:hypothetical protein